MGEDLHETHSNQCARSQVCQNNFHGFECFYKSRVPSVQFEIYKQIASVFALPINKLTKCIRHLVIHLRAVGIVWAKRKQVYCSLLVWQLVPVKPATHAHVYLLSPSVHVPPFRHGLGEQSSISAKIGATKRMSLYMAKKIIRYYRVMATKRKLQELKPK